MKTHLLLGTRKGLVIYRRENNSYVFESHHFEGIPISYAMKDPRNGRLWACQDHGHWGCKLSFSDDMGKNWTEAEAPKYPEGEEIKTGVPATMKYLWCLSAGNADEPNRLWLGTEPGGFFRSDDNGKSWELVRSLWDRPERKENWFGGGRDYAGIDSVIIDPKNSKHIFIAVSCGGVYETNDDGLTWEWKNKGLRADFLPDPYSEYGHDPHYMAAFNGDVNLLWQQNHCGIFRSSDGGKNWADISETEGPAKFGFAIATDEKLPETAWVVPAVADTMRVAVKNALCVCRTDDGGKTWKRFGNGLPQEHSYDVVFRHGLDITGDTLAFGSTTGNVFFSNDRGENWNCLGNYFAPVYSVRMA